jgi:hypothetical protein
LVRFFISLFLVTAVIGGVVLLGVDLGYFTKPSFFETTLLLLLFSTGIIYRYLYKANNSGFFVQLYLLTMTLKLLFYCTYIFIIVHKDKNAAFGNVVFFMTTYILFTSLEIGFLHTKVSRKTKS